MRKPHETWITAGPSFFQPAMGGCVFISDRWGLLNRTKKKKKKHKKPTKINFLNKCVQKCDHQVD
jgi:hypothetical protein